MNVRIENILNGVNMYMQKVNRCEHVYEFRDNLAAVNRLVLIQS